LGAAGAELAAGAGLPVWAGAPSKPPATSNTTATQIKERRMENSLGKLLRKE
jgi:hypothetical protein